MILGFSYIIEDMIPRLACAWPASPQAALKDIFKAEEGRWG